MKTTITLWSLTGLFAAIGSFVATHGGWGMVRSPFLLEFTKTVYRTNWVDVEVPKMMIRYVDVPTPAIAKSTPLHNMTNESMYFITNIPNDWTYVTNLLMTNIFITTSVNSNNVFSTYVTNR